MARMVRDRWGGERGQTLIEYVLLLGAIAVVAVAALTFLSPTIEGSLGLPTEETSGAGAGGAAPGNRFAAPACQPARGSGRGLVSGPGGFQPRSATATPTPTPRPGVGVMRGCSQSDP